MAEENTVNTGANENQPAGDSQDKTFTQDEVNKIVGERLAKEKAKYSDYERYKADSEQLTKIQNKNKSKIERANERAERAEAERDALIAERNLAAWKEEAAKAYGVPAEVLRGDNEDQIITHAKELAPHFQQHPAPVIKSDGHSPKGVKPSLADQFAEVIDRAKK